MLELQTAMHEFQAEPPPKKNIFFVAYGLSGAQKLRFSCFVAPDKQQIHRDVAAHCMYRNMTSAAKLSERELYHTHHSYPPQNYPPQKRSAGNLRGNY